MDLYFCRTIYNHTLTGTYLTGIVGCVWLWQMESWCNCVWLVATLRDTWVLDAAIFQALKQCLSFVFYSAGWCRHQQRSHYVCLTCKEWLNWLWLLGHQSELVFFLLLSCNSRLIFYSQNTESDFMICQIALLNFITNSHVFLVHGAGSKLWRYCT